MTFVTTWVDLEGIIQSEMRLTEIPKDMWNQKKKKKKKKQSQSIHGVFCKIYYILGLKNKYQKIKIKNCVLTKAYTGNNILNV